MRRKAVVLLVGTGLLLAARPVLATATPPPPPSAAAEREALGVLARAARAGSSLSYSGTQYVAAWGDGTGGATVVDVDHAPGRPPVVTSPPTAGEPPAPLAATAALDARLLDVLADSYDLLVAGPGRCAGRSAAVVEARADDGHVAGRFWVDQATGLLLRREVYDDAGRRVRSSAFVDLQVRAASAAPAPTASAEPAGASPGELREQGWRVPASLPAGMRLLETRTTPAARGTQVLHLVYSDGLSTMSLFGQPGELGTSPPEGFGEEQVDGRPVWVRHAAPERVVWRGDGRVWTLVSDAPGETVRAAVAALPRDPAPRDGVLSRFARGLNRLASLLNPFD